MPSAPPGWPPPDRDATASRSTSARSPGARLPPCDLLQQPMALLVGEHSVRALRRLEQDAARGLVVRVVAVRLQPILHVRQPRDRRDLDLLHQAELLGGDRAVDPRPDTPV